MDAHTEHTIVLNTLECAALLAAAKTLIDLYENENRNNEARTSLQDAVVKIMKGMGLNDQKREELSDFMDHGIPAPKNNPWGFLA